MGCLCQLPAGLDIDNEAGMPWARRPLSSKLCVDLTKTGAWTRRDRIGMRVSSRSESHRGPGYRPSGRLDMRPDSSYQHRFLNLAPTGREMNYELS